MLVRLLASLLMLGVTLNAPLSACPLCKEAISTSDNEDEVNNLPAAYNNSIYLMITVPYVTLAVLGFLIYRGVRKNHLHATSELHESL